MVISSEFRMEQNRDDDHREDAPHFTILKYSESENDYEMEKSGTRKNPVVVYPSQAKITVFNPWLFIFRNNCIYRIVNFSQNGKLRKI